MTIIYPEDGLPVGAVALQQPSLLLSNLNLMMHDIDPTIGAMVYALGDDMGFGDPEAVIAAIQSQLQDGDLERVDRYGNREALIPLAIEAPDADDIGDALARMAAELDAACRFDGWTELAYTPPLAGAATSVYEVTSATIATTFDDLEEMEQGCRYVTLSIHARPFPRTVDPITIDAPAAVGSNTTTVDSGGSTTGWSMLSTAPAALKNLVPNPSFEVNTTGWTAGSGSESLSRHAYVGGEGITGAGSFKSIVIPVFGAVTCYENGPTFAVAADTSYALSVYIAANPTSSVDGSVTQIGLMYRWYNSSGTQIGGDHTVTATPHSTPYAFKRVSTVGVSPAGAATVRIYPFVKQDTSRGATSFETDAAMVSPATAVGAYFDGNTPDTAAITYSWDGTTNNSASTGTWTAPSLAVVAGAVKGTVYGRASASIRRNSTGITGVEMATLPYIRIKGTASAYSDGQVTVADDGGASLATTSYSYNSTTGAFEILINRASGFTNLDVTFARTGGTVSTTDGVFVAVDQIDITDNPFATGKTQTRQVAVYGSQRTELSLSILGLDAAGTTPVGLGDQVLVHTAAAGDDGRAKFLACRAAAGLAGTSDTGAVSGAYNTLSTTASPTSFTFSASTLLTGNYMAYARVRCGTVGATELSFRAFVDPTVGDNVYDPVGGAWKTVPLTVVGTPSVAQWPQLFQSTWVLVPLGMLRLPPADVEDASATITVQIARASVSVDVDDIFLCNTDVGQASILLTNISSGSYSAVRLDAATVDSPQEKAWFGAANGTMLTEPARWAGGEQHTAGPGLLQVSTVTPGCATSRVSAHYYPRFHTYVVDSLTLVA
jgi:hypothetical protein